RSTDFYQGLFGLPLRRVSSTNIQLVIGSGPLHVGLTAAANGESPKIDHYCLIVESFDVDQIVKTLAEHGVSKSSDRGPMKVQVNMRGDTPQVYVGDPDGIAVQLQGLTYCGGSGPLGSTCSAPEPAPRKGLIALKGYSHLTIFSGDAQKSNAFHKSV